MLNWKDLLLPLVLIGSDAFAATAMSDRYLVEQEVRQEVEKDLAASWEVSAQVQKFSGRTCLDGRPIQGFTGHVVELWVDLECVYCGIKEPWQAQRQGQDMCVVVRHIPSEGGDSLKKALSYEALKKFSANAANLFWDKVAPQTGLAIPVPYEGALLAAFQEAAIAPDKFSEVLTKDAQEIVSQDILEGQTRITSTPTYVLEGIRFGSCDFSAQELPEALALAKKAREGDAEAVDEVISIITRGKLNEKLI